MSPKNVHEKSPKKRTFRGHFCPRNVTYYVHEMSATHIFGDYLFLKCQRQNWSSKLKIFKEKKIKDLDDTCNTCSVEYRHRAQEYITWYTPMLCVYRLFIKSFCIKFRCSDEIFACMAIECIFIWNFQFQNQFGKQVFEFASELGQIVPQRILHKPADHHFYRSHPWF